MSVTPASVSMQPGQSASISVLASGLNGFTSQVTAQITGLPPGVSASSTQLTLTPGSAQQVTLSAQSSSLSSTSNVLISGSSGALSHQTQLALKVSPPSGSIPAITRTEYVHTNAATPYGFLSNSHWIVFSPTTERFFVTDPSANRVFVIDAISRTVVTALNVPGAFGMDDTPDHNTIYVGTQIGDLYVIDAVSLTVTKRYPAATIGVYGAQAFVPLVMSDGRLALLTGQRGFQAVDGYGGFVLWDPVTNATEFYSMSYSSPGNEPTTLVCGPAMTAIAGYARTPDRTKILISSAFSDATMCLVDPTTGTYIYTNVSRYPTLPAISPDNTTIVTLGYSNSVNVYDAATLNLKKTFPAQGTTLIISPDSKTLFASSDSIVYAYDLSSGQLVGWTPNIFVVPQAGGLVVGAENSASFQAFDSTGLIAGPLEEGVAFVDTSALNTGPVGTQFTNGYVVPAGGPVTGGTSVTLPDPNPSASVTSAYFGGAAAPSATLSSGVINMISPPGNSGPVDLYVFTIDGGMQLLPEAFSYGPWIVQATPDSAAAGGGAGVLYGYGFGSVANGTSIPADLQISVGGQPAQVTGFLTYAYPYIAPPFPLQAVFYTIPAGTAGQSVDITVTTSQGSMTARGAMAYLQQPPQYPCTCTSLAQGVYDPQRDVYYFTDEKKIQVFSLATSQWLAPINIPSNNFSERLWGISLSPDGSKLAVADADAPTIYLLDPSTPTSVQAFALPDPYAPNVITRPASVAIADSGIVYYTAFVTGGTGYHSFFQLNTNTSAVTDLGITGPGLGLNDANLRTQISADGARAYFNLDGLPFTIDTATGKMLFAALSSGCCYGDYDLALASNQTRFAASSYFYDADLNAESYIGLTQRESWFLSYLYGMKLSPDGELLFQPTTLGIDVIDGHTGVLRSRISLTDPPSVTFDDLVSDGKDNVLLAITGSNADSVSVLDFTGLSEPSPLGYQAASTWALRDLTVPFVPRPADSNRHRPARSNHVRHLIITPDKVKISSK